MKYELTILMPCLNEEKTLEQTINNAKKFIERTNINAEILIVDNGSTDSSYQIAKKHATRVIKEEVKGYGSALRAGISVAEGEYIIFGDCDTTYDFENLDEYVKYLREGYDMVIGNRFAGGIEKGAMPFMHKYIGVPILSFLGKVKYNVKINDFHCGLRGLNTKKARSLKFETTGMEFATEIIAKFLKAKCTIKEIPTVLKKGDITRKPHLRTFRDGFRHLKYIILN